MGQAKVLNINEVELDGTDHMVVGYSAEVEWSDDEQAIIDRGTYLFVGSSFGSPGAVWLDLNGKPQPVVQPERFGVRFNESWVRNFYA